LDFPLFLFLYISSSHPCHCSHANRTVFFWTGSPQQPPFPVSLAVITVNLLTTTRPRPRNVQGSWVAFCSNHPTIVFFPLFPTPPSVTASSCSGRPIYPRHRLVLPTLSGGRLTSYEPSFPGFFFSEPPVSVCFCTLVLELFPTRSTSVLIYVPLRPTLPLLPLH